MSIITLYNKTDVTEKSVLIEKVKPNHSDLVRHEYKNVSKASMVRINEYVLNNYYSHASNCHYWTRFSCSEDKIERNHYKMLNIGANSEPLPSEKWEINEEIYWYALEVLPPLKQVSNGFVMSEFYTSNITTMFTKMGDQHFCQFVRFSQGRVLAL